MVPRQSETLRGTVLHVSNFGDSHRIVELLSGPAGRVQAVARGARASKKRFSGALDLFVELNIKVTGGAELRTLQTADIVAPRLGIRRSLPQVRRASILCEAARLLSPVNQEAEEMLAALDAGLNALDENHLAQAAAAYPQMMHAAGIGADVAQCQGCGIEAPTVIGITHVGNQILCTCCDPQVIPLREDVRLVLAGGPCVDATVATNVETIAVRWIESHTGVCLKSPRATTMAVG